MPTVELINESKGLPFNFVTDIVQDQEGFIWISGPDGICRYDGYRFWSLPSEPTDSTTLYSRETYGFGLGPRGTIWAGHPNGKISIINPVTGKVKRLDFPEAKGQIATRIFTDSKGTVWLAVNTLGIFKFQNNQFVYIDKPRHFPKDAAPSTFGVLEGINRFFETRFGTIWVATNNGLYVVSENQKKLNHVSYVSTDTKQGAFVHNILAEGDSIFWLPTYGDGIIRYELKSGKFKSYTFEKGWKGTYNIVYNAAWKNKSEILFTSWGIANFNTQTKKFSFYYDRTEWFGQLNTSNIMVDYNGTVWATSDQGLFKYNEAQQPFLFHKLKVAKSDNRSYYGVTKVIYDSVGERSLISTTMTEGLFILDKNGSMTSVQVPRHPYDEPYQILYNVAQTQDSRIIVSSRAYLSELTPQNQIKPFYELNKLLPKDKIPYFVRFLEATNGDWYVGTYGNGLFRRKKSSSQWTRFNPENNERRPASSNILALHEGKDGKIWIGYSTYGVDYYDPIVNKWKNFEPSIGDSSSVISNKFTNLAVHPNGNVWIATLDGVSIYDPKTEKFTFLKLADGLIVKPAYNIAADDFGNMWITTKKNLMMVRPDLSYRFFGYNDGLSGFIAGYKISRIGYDYMQFGTQGGFLTFKPSQIMNQAQLKSPLVFTEVRNGNAQLENFRTGQDIEINYDNNHITISFAALNYMPHKNTFLYRMKGLDNVWTETTTPLVTYSGMPSGEFSFQLKLKDGETSFLSLPINVTYPYYKTLWFRLSLILVSFWGIFLVYKLRLRQIRKVEKLKSDLKQQLAEAETKALKAQMSPHFIFNSLNSINRYIVKNEPELASTYLTKFSKLIRLILDNSNQKIISLDQELLYLKLYVELEALRFNDKFTHCMQISPEINPQSVGVPPMIIQPFIENAIWHGLLHKETPGHLDVSFKHFGSNLLCIITDNGIGRKKAAELKSKTVNKEKSYGMKITKDRLDMLNGDDKISNVEIVDMKDEMGNPLGTKVIVKIMSAEMEPEF
jgi:sensor histidine kinase YesM/ligand-binding sensor domain-containing protein